MKKVFHLSMSNLHGKTLHPRVPDNYMVRQGFEDNKTERVCLSESYEGALMALGRHIKPGTKFFVHTPANRVTIIPNSSIKNKVPDAHITKEVWVLEDVKLQVIEVIEVLGDDGKEYNYKYGMNNEYEATLYGYKIRRHA